MADRILGDAATFALKAHGVQRYGRKPYHVHLLDTVNVLRRFFEWDELPQAFVDAAWLHDTIEDTSTTAADIEHRFGPRVSELVIAVTNPDRLIGDKATRVALLYSKIRDTSGAVNIKLADRIANVEQCISYGRVGRTPSRLFDKYSKAWPDFKRELKGLCRGEGYSAREMWDHLQMLIDLGDEEVERGHARWQN